MHILPIIQSVIIRCMYSWNIYKQLMSPIGSLVPQLVKNPPALWETWVWSLSWEDPLEKGKAIHSSILAWSIKKKRDYFANKGPSNQSHGFLSSYVWMWELDHKERWAPKSWCFWTVVLEKSPLDYKEIKPVHPKGDQSWIFIGRTDAEAEIPMLWPPDAKNWLIGKDPDAGKDWEQEKRATEDEMVRWHHWLNGHEFEQAPGVGDGQGGCSPWDLRVDTTEQLNWTECVRWHQRLSECLMVWDVCMC